MWQSTFLCNGQHPIVAWGTNIARFYKIGGPNRALNYWGTKSKTGDKLGTQNAILAKNKYSWYSYISFILSLQTLTQV